MFSCHSEWTALYTPEDWSTLPKWGCLGCGLLCPSHQDSEPPGELWNVNMVEICPSYKEREICTWTDTWKNTSEASDKGKYWS